MRLKVWNILCLLLILCGFAAADSDPDPALDQTNTTTPSVPEGEPSQESSLGPVTDPDPGPGVTDSSYNDTTTAGVIISESKMNNDSDPNPALDQTNTTTPSVPPGEPSEDPSLGPVPDQGPEVTNSSNSNATAAGVIIPESRMNNDSSSDPALDNTNSTAPITPPGEPSNYTSVGPVPDAGPEVTNSSNSNATAAGVIASAAPESKRNNGSDTSSLDQNLAEPPTLQAPPLGIQTPPLFLPNLDGSSTSQASPQPFGNETLPWNSTDLPHLNETTLTDLNTTYLAPINPSNQTLPSLTPESSKPANLSLTNSSKDGLNETFSGDSFTSTAPPPKDIPTQHHVGGDTVMVHRSPSLDPLVIGLVSAFIISAVIVTLLLFLRRHRRHRSEFSRLQDVSMDEVVEEDTPLSMYNY